MISQDLLHQVIKGTFKDHLVTWVVDYIQCSNSDGDASHILDELDHRWVAICITICNFTSLTVLALASPLSLHSHVYAAFRKDEASSNGPVTIPRPWWRCFYQLLRGSSWLRWLDVLPLSSTSAILYAMIFMTPLLFQLPKKPLTSSTVIVTSSRMSGFVRTSIFHDNTLFDTMYISSENMAPPMAFALQSQRIKISRLSRNHGNNPTNGRLCVRCLSLTSAWISWRRHAPSLNPVVCSKVPLYLAPCGTWVSAFFVPG